MSIGIIFSYLLIAFFVGGCIFFLNILADGFFFVLGLLDNELQDKHMQKLHKEWKKKKAEAEALNNLKIFFNEMREAA